MAMQNYHGEDQVGLSRKPLRLIIDISPDLQQRLEAAAAESGLSVHKYVEHLLEQTVPSATNLRRRRRGLNSEAVADMLRTSEEIMNAHPGQMFNSAETLYELREERTKELEQR